MQLVSPNQLKEVEEYKTKNFVPLSASKWQSLPVNEFPYLIDKIVPINAVTAIVGDTNCGKSLLALKLADAISSGNKFLGEFEVQQTKTLYIDLEMNEDDIIYRTRIICSPNNENLFILLANSFKADNVINLQALKDYIIANKIGLVVFDTFSKIHDGEENSNTAINQLFNVLRPLLRELQITIIILHHNSKNPDATKMNKGRGATAIKDNVAAYIDITSELTYNQNNQNVLCMVAAQLKIRRTMVKSFGVNITFIDNSPSVWEYRPAQAEKIDKLEEDKKRLLKFIMDNPGSTKTEIKRYLNDNFKMAKNYVDYVINLLLNVNKVKEVIGRCNAKQLFYNDLSLKQPELELD